MRNERDQILELQDRLQDALEDLAELQRRVDRAVEELRRLALYHAEVWQAIGVLEGTR